LDVPLSGHRQSLADAQPVVMGHRQAHTGQRTTAPHAASPDHPGESRCPCPLRGGVGAQYPPQCTCPRRHCAHLSAKTLVLVHALKGSAMAAPRALAHLERALCSLSGGRGGADPTQVPHDRDPALLCATLQEDGTQEGHPEKERPRHEDGADGQVPHADPERTVYHWRTWHGCESVSETDPENLAPSFLCTDQTRSSGSFFGNTQGGPP
jgi:hypothetical protein